MGRHLDPDQFRRMKTLFIVLPVVTISFVIHEVFGRTAWLIGFAICSAPFVLFLIWRLGLLLRRRA